MNREKLTPNELLNRIYDLKKAGFDVSFERTTEGLILKISKVANKK
jgi:hypothetical protein